MKVGSKVRIKDGSYMTTIEDGTVKEHSRKIQSIGLNRDTWTVIAMDGIFPIITHSWTTPGRVNNVIIQNDVNDEIWYCIGDVCLFELSEPRIPEYTMYRLTEMIGHEFKIKG